MLLPLCVVCCGEEHIVDSDGDGSVRTITNTMMNIQMVLVKMKPYNERVLKKKKKNKTYRENGTAQRVDMKPLFNNRNAEKSGGASHF